MLVDYDQDRAIYDKSCEKSRRELDFKQRAQDGKTVRENFVLKSEKTTLWKKRPWTFVTFCNFIKIKNIVNLPALFTSDQKTHSQIISPNKYL